MGRKRTSGRVASNKKHATDHPLGDVKGEGVCVFCCAPVSTDMGSAEQLNNFVGQVLEAYLPPGGGNVSEDLCACDQCLPQVQRVLRGDRELREAEEEVRRLQRQLLLRMQRMCERLTALWTDLRGLGEVMELSEGHEGSGDMVRSAINSVVGELGRFCEASERKVGTQTGSTPGDVPTHQKVAVREEEVEVPRSPPDSPGASENAEVFSNAEGGMGSPAQDEEDAVSTASLEHDAEEQSNEESEVEESGDDDWKPKPKRIRKEPHTPTKVGVWNSGRPIHPEDPHRDVATSAWSSAKKNLFYFVRRNLRKQEIAAHQGNTDPLLEQCMTYDVNSDSFSVGGIPVFVHDSSLQCSECHFTLTPAPGPRKGVMGSRMQEHVQGRHLSAFKCPHCPAQLSNRTTYNNHVHSHEGRHLCSDCGKVLSSAQGLRAHRWRMHMTPEEIAEALAAGETDPRYPSVPEQRFVCDICGKAYLFKSGLRTHERQEHQGERHPCDRCGKVFRQKQRLMFHQTRICLPPGEEPPPQLPCPVSGCRKTFQSETTRRRHVEAVHSDNKILKPYKCDQCPKGFSTKDNLTHHLESHRQDKPYECQLGCGMTFKTARYRARHERTWCKARPSANNFGSSVLKSEENDL